MSEVAGDEGGGEGELAPPDWRVRAGPRNTDAERGKEHDATRVPFRDWCRHCMMSRGRTHHQVSKHKSEDHSRRPTFAMDFYVKKTNSVVNAQTISEESVT